MGPTAAFTINPAGQSLANTPVTFTDNSTGNVTNWHWDFGDGDSSNIQNPVHIYPNNGNYNITLIVTDTNGCSDTLIVPYSIISNIIKPNVITPNGDGQNDFLVFENLEFYDNNLKIFNRWGTVMFETINYKNNWDGDDLSEGTYFYILEVQKDGETELHKGTINLLR
jgi:gliding motility-associated-like protein